MTETAEATQTQTDATSSEAAATSLLTSAAAAATDSTASEETKTPATEVKTEETRVEGAPETYDFKAPEGKAYDSALLESLSSSAKAANLTQDAAQKLLDGMAPKLVERQLEQVKQVQNQWVETSKVDPEFGGVKLQENLGIAKKALDQFDPVPAGQTTTALRTLLETTGFGNHPDVVRLLYRAGKAISEDKFVSGASISEKPRDIGAILYDNTTKG